jgi:hypothetical protein
MAGGLRPRTACTMSLAGIWWFGKPTGGRYGQPPGASKASLSRAICSPRYFPDEADYLASTRQADVEAALERLRAVIARRAETLSSGRLDSPGTAWRNSAMLVSREGEVRWYDKNTLSAVDWQDLVVGDELSGGLCVATRSAEAAAVGFRR